MENKPYKIGNFIVGLCIFDATTEQEIDYAELGIAPPKGEDLSEWKTTALNIHRIEAVYPSINLVDGLPSVKIQMIDDAYDMQCEITDILTLLK